MNIMTRTGEAEKETAFEVQDISILLFPHPAIAKFL
jgi:hypothetical protein